VVVAFFHIKEAPIVKGGSILGIESNGLGGIGNGSVVITFFKIISGPLEKGVSVLGIESNGLGVIGNGPGGNRL
jgi:hypothetical protein